MLAWMQEQRIPGIDDVIAYGDDASPFIFYLIASTPRFRIGPDGSPVFQFLKYREPVPREGGKKGGGFLICDVEFSVPGATVKKCQEALQEQVNANPKFTRINPKPVVQIREVSFTKGASSMQLFDSGAQNAALVERVQNPGAPSLYGDLITPFTVEFSAEGATLAEQALQAKGPSLQVVYDLYAPVKLPPITVHVWFHAQKFMSFHQKVDINDGWYSDHSYRENIQQQFISSECGNVDIDPGAVTDQKIINTIRDWGFQTLEDAIKRMVLGDIPEVSSDAQKVPDGIKHLTRDISESKIVDFNRSFTEGMVIEPNLGPRGSLPGINTLTGKDGKPLKWSDFSRTVDLNDPFFQQINVNIRGNADFANLPIFSIDGRISYDEGKTHTSLPFTLTNPNDVVKFASFIENNKKAYQYSYKVKYKVKYDMKDGKTYFTDWKSNPAAQVYVGSPFGGRKTISLRAIGDLQSDVGTIFLDVKYADDTNHYIQSNSVALSKLQPFIDWTFPVIDDSLGKVTYSGTIQFQDGQVQNIAETTATKNTILVGRPKDDSEFLSVTVQPDLVDFTRVKLVKVALHYADPGHDVDSTKDFVITKNTTAAPVWTVRLQDKSKKSYDYRASFFLLDGTSKSIGPITSNEPMLLLEMPMAAAPGA